jgi:DNA-binding XRE family transcriptional regulator
MPRRVYELPALGEHGIVAAPVAGIESPRGKCVRPFVGASDHNRSGSWCQCGVLGRGIDVEVALAGIYSLHGADSATAKFACQPLLDNFTWQWHPVHMADKNHQWGTRLWAARTEAGMSARELARQAGCTGQYIGLAEGGGVASPGIDMVRRLAAALNVDADWLAFGTKRA